MHVHKTEKTKKYIYRRKKNNLSRSLDPSHPYFFIGNNNCTQVLVIPPKDTILL